jgi:hypothetical protein
VGLCLALTLAAGAVGARAQTASPIAFDPNNAALGTALVIAADGTALSSGGSPASSFAVALPRGTRVDAAARSVLCDRGQAARGTCPLESRIGFGRFVVAVDGYAPGGRTELTWSLDAYLGKPAQRGDVASVVLSATLLGADSVAELLEPALGTTVPRNATTIGRLVRRRSGAYGFDLRFPGLPAQLQVAAPITATPARLELSLSAVRRVRQNFIRRYRIRTPSGYEVRRIRDHRLVGHELLRTPRTCSGSWPYELTVGFPGGVQRSAGRLPCTQALTVGRR